ncbi:MAG: hypothetical protein KC586_07420 [Myxococcales bacterium]|nr:hypothetical protein [Myxococcales bacterium]
MLEPEASGLFVREEVRGAVEHLEEVREIQVTFDVVHLATLHESRRRSTRAS